MSHWSSGGMTFAWYSIVIGDVLVWPSSALRGVKTYGPTILSQSPPHAAQKVNDNVPAPVVRLLVSSLMSAAGSALSSRLLFPLSITLQTKSMLYERELPYQPVRSNMNSIF